MFWYTDIRNERSQRAIARLGATRDGVIRRHRPRRRHLAGHGAVRDDGRGVAGGGGPCSASAWPQPTETDWAPVAVVRRGGGNATVVEDLHSSEVAAVVVFEDLLGHLAEDHAADQAARHAGGHRPGQPPSVRDAVTADRARDRPCPP